MVMIAQLLIGGRDMVSDCTLLSPRELAAESAWPEKRIRLLIKMRSIRYLKFNGRYLLPKNALEEFVENHMVVPKVWDGCKTHDPTRCDDSDYVGSDHAPS